MLALILLAPPLGAANLVVFVVIGQLTAAHAIDQFRLIGFPIAPLTPGRHAGAALLVGRAAVIRLT